MLMDAAYWIALAHLPRWGHYKINNLIKLIFIDNKISLEEFFNLSDSDYRSKYLLNDKEIADLKLAKSELANNAFLAEKMYSEGYELIPINSPEYPKTLKENLKMAHAPSLVYTKGNKKILSEKSIAIVGSRDASEKSLEFTDNIAKLASEQFKVVVSGFAKGVDKQALDSAIKYIGQSIIVLPQGILTFGSGFQKYYREIVDGNVLVLSTFHPKAPWRAELAMARNPIIYGLANEIFVAESSEKGGTWSGVLDGIKKGREIFVRLSEPEEKNANILLIEKGAKAVDFNGSVINKEDITYQSEQELSNQNIKNNILELLKSREMTSKQLLESLNLDWNSRKMSTFIKNIPDIEVLNSKPQKFKFKSNIFQGALFAD